jgi:hypothetical protein
MLLSEGQMSDYKGAALMLNALPRARAFSGLTESAGFSLSRIRDSFYVLNRHGGFDGQALFAGLA